MQDGTIEYQIKLTGELSTNPLSPDEDPSSPTYGTLVAENVNAQAHQHLVRFLARVHRQAPGEIRESSSGRKPITLAGMSGYTCAL